MKKKRKKYKKKKSIESKNWKVSTRKKKVEEKFLKKKQIHEVEKTGSRSRENWFTKSRKQVR